jgi:hypothetical protein
MGMIGYIETSVSNYQSRLHNIQEEQRSQLGNSLPRVHLFVDVTKYHGWVNPSDDDDDNDDDDDDDDVDDDDDDTRFRSIVLSNVTTFPVRRSTYLAVKPLKKQPVFPTATCHALYQW